MKPLRRRVLRLAAGAAALAGLVLASEGTSPQTQRTIKLIVPSVPGGATDLLARLLGEQIGRTQGATVVIENRPGPAKSSARKQRRAPRSMATRSCSPPIRSSSIRTCAT
jgi:hypothetical protein